VRRHRQVSRPDKDVRAAAFSIDPQRSERDRQAVKTTPAEFPPDRGPPHRRARAFEKIQKIYGESTGRGFDVVPSGTTPPPAGPDEWPPSSR
jgi:hypothetical protein